MGGDCRPPRAAAATYDSVRAAAQTRDYAALAAFLDPARFVYSFGDGGDPIGYWMSLDGEGTDPRAIMAAVLAMPCARIEGDSEGPYYVWPRAAEVPYAELSAPEKAALDALYGADVDMYYIEGRAIGYYVGWRLLIAEDGAWHSFVAGD